MINRREALARLAALAALPAASRHWSFAAATDPLDGTIYSFQAGRRAGEWTSEEITRRALERCQVQGQRWRAIDVLTPERALADARASDARLRAGKPLGPLDGVPLFAKAIYDLDGVPTTGSSAEWARLFQESVHRDALEVRRLRAAGAVIL